MLNSIIRRVALALMIRAVREDNEELLRLYWDLKYIYKYGIVTDWNEPQPDPSPLLDPTPTPVIERVGIHEELLFEIIDVFAEDPQPEPSILSILGDREIRLAAAEGLAQRLETALEQVNTEIERLG